MGARRAVRRPIALQFRRRLIRLVNIRIVPFALRLRLLAEHVLVVLRREFHGLLIADVDGQSRRMFVPFSDFRHRRLLPCQRLLVRRVAQIRRMVQHDAVLLG